MFLRIISVTDIIFCREEYDANMKEKKGLFRKDRSQWEKSLEEKDDEIAKLKEKV